MDVVVTDGIEMGRPCCSVRHCTEALISTQDRYCPSHRSLASLCAISGCGTSIEEGYATCSDVLHRQVEDWHRLHGKGMFNLRRFLQRTRQPADSSRTAETGGADDTVVDDVQDDSEALPVLDDMNILTVSPCEYLDGLTLLARSEAI